MHIINRHSFGLVLGLSLALGLGLAACSDEEKKAETPKEETQNDVAVPPAQGPRTQPASDPAPEPVSPRTPTEGVGYDAVGKASFYSDALQGRLTASEEPYDKSKFTAAHRELPFGSVLRVTNIKNGRSTIVRVNDRGPFAHSRILDVSRAAAEALGLVRAGVARMRVTLVREADGDVVNDQWLQDAEGHLPVPESLLPVASAPAPASTP